MKDKSLNITLVLIFGISGITMLMLAWLQPIPGQERGMAFFIGSVGLLVASIRLLTLKAQRLPVETGTVALEIKPDDKL